MRYLPLTANDRAEMMKTIGAKSVDDFYGDVPVSARLKGPVAGLPNHAGELEVEFCPQGTLAERMRAGGAGIPGFYTTTGVGTLVAEGKETKVFANSSGMDEEYVLERGIFADLSLVKAWKADETGNVVFRKTARNFNVPAATCGKVCVVEVEEIVPTGSLDPDCIHLPGVYVQRLMVGSPYDKKIEFRTVREREAA